MQCVVRQEFVLGSATLTVEIEDTRDGFDLKLFNWLVTDMQDHIQRGCIRALVAEAEYLSGDGSSRHDVERSFKDATTTISIRLDVTFHHPRFQERLNEVMEQFVNALINGTKRALNDECLPEPDIEGFMKEYEALHASEGCLTDDRIRQLMMKYNFDGRVDVGVLTVSMPPAQDGPLGELFSAMGSGRGSFAGSAFHVRGWGSPN